MRKFTYREVIKLEEKDLYELLKIEPIDPKIIENFEKQPKEEIILTKKFKRKMNRIFREKLCSSKIPHPEVDNLFEKLRSNIISIIVKK